MSDSASSERDYAPVLDFLWALASRFEGGSVTDQETGRLFHVRETVARPIWCDIDSRWRREVSSFRRAFEGRDRAR